MINMVFPPVDSLIQEKIITAHLAGKGRNQIWRNLNEQGLRVSSASVTNIINRHKRRQRETSSIVATTNTAADQNKDGSPSFNSRSEEPVNVEEPMDFSDISYPEPYPNANIEPEVNTKSVTTKVNTPQKEDSEQHQSQSSLRMSSNKSKSKSDLEPEEEPLLIPDCNPDESHETILWKRIMAEKKQRQEEYQIIQRERQKLVEYEPMLKSVKELKAYGITLEALKSYSIIVEYLYHDVRLESNSKLPKWVGKRILSKKIVNEKVFTTLGSSPRA
jgi:hypothetical protein